MLLKLPGTAKLFFCRALIELYTLPISVRSRQFVNFFRCQVVAVTRCVEGSFNDLFTSNLSTLYSFF